MITIGIDYLNGVSVATDPSDYEKAEWPPHPARVYTALAAAHFESSDDASERNIAERLALEWLESLPPPEIACAVGNARPLVAHFVAVNDVNTEGVLPRRRQERFFPATVLGDDSRVWMSWPTDPDKTVQSALEQLAERVSRIGHSSSFVRVHLAPSPEQGTVHWKPSERGSIQLRVPTAGLLSSLERSFLLGQRPSIGTWHTYEQRSDRDKPPAHSVFDPRLIVLRSEGRAALDLTYTARATETLRLAMMSNAPGELPEVLSGHAADGRPSERPHVAFFPLPFVEGEHADGHLMGLGIALPRELSREERFDTLAVLASRLGGRKSNFKLNLGRLGIWELKVERSEDPPLNLQSRGYTRPSKWWATVTPVVLDRYAHDEEEQAEIVATSCERIGLPIPDAVRVSKFSHFRSVPPAWEFPPMRAGKGGAQRYHVHVTLRFAAAVEGPLLIGAGRYRGYGLFRPMRERS